MKILFRCLGASLFVLNSAFHLMAQAPPKAETAATDSLEFLNAMVGKNTYDAKTFEHPTMKARLTSLLGSKARLVPERFQTTSSIEKEGDIVFMMGNKAHMGGTDAAVIIGNVRTNELWVWLNVAGQLTRVGPAADPKPMPADAGTFVSNMKAKP